jgi:hypothetical protein
MLLLVGCSHSYAPPMQRMFPIERADLDPPFMDVAAIDAADYVVKDIDLANGIADRRWTRARPELRFFLNSTEGQKFVADVILEEYVLDRIGPLSLTVYINGNRLETYRLEKSLETHLEKPVPAAWLKTGEDTRVVLEPDKVFTGGDGVKFGFSLYRAGFIE